MLKLKWAAVAAVFVALLCSAGTVFAADGSPEVDTGTTAWMLTSTGLVLLMVPGLAMFYGGLVRTKNVLGTMMHSFAAMAIVGVIWVVCGYSMSFGSNVLGGWFGWNSDYFLLKGIDTTIMDAGISEYVFAMFQGKFAIITPALIAGAFAERVKFRGYCIFIALIAAEITRITVIRLDGHGRQEGTEIYCGLVVVPNLIPKVELKIAVNEEFIDITVDTILKSARHGENGKVGDGKIFITPLEECICISNGARSGEAI